MPDSGLTERIDALEKRRATLVMIAARSDEARKFDLLAERRALAATLAGLQHAATIAGARFASGADSEEFLTRFSEVRAAIANHQSAWSAVAINDFPDDYRRSANGVSHKIGALVTWLRAKSRAHT